MKRAWSLLLLALLTAWPGTALATSGGTSLRYGGGGQGTVMFDGRLHASKGFRCEDCHTKLFDTKKVAHITMADHFTDKACFKCHNNTNKTDPMAASRDCATCHRKVASNYETSTDAMAGIIATAFTGDDTAKAVLLTGNQGATAQSTACLSCHGAATPPKPVTERGKTLDLHVDVADYRHGAHANLPCATCHTGQKGAESFTQAPHAVVRPDNATCLSCHNVGLAHQIKAFGQSAHAEKLKDKVSCGNCHNPHAQPQKPQQVAYASLTAMYNAQCLACHDNAAKLKELSGKDVPDAKAAHAFLTNWSAHSRSVMCVECHTPVADPNDHLIGEKKTAVRDCATCHTDPGKSLIVVRATPHTGGAAPVTSGYFPPNQVAPVLSAVGGTAVSGVFALALLHGLGRALPRRRHTGALVSEYMYPAFVRATHWVNAALFLLLGYTGLSVRFTEASWALGLEAATRIHNVCGVLLALNFFAYVIRAVATGDIRQYLPGEQGGLRPLLLQARYYCRGIFRGEAHPYPATLERRFNPLQRMAYLVVFLVGMPVLLASGLLLLMPEAATAIIAPRPFLVAAHLTIVIGFALFFVGHLYLATTGATPLSLIKGMMTGRHEHPMDKPLSEGKPSGD
ncbi:cytochrome c3 family protein [Desulfovibrio sp. TomC]|uniref:cytochrome c3 family protein n=1 Tax=Desulfovibrio sp. TomC TaxID=1562888 RepID=UPI000574668C|nr:cytochrome c3 family protein [Desulfovibrio sp. TomC]KHK01344.1 Cytochrome c552 precursor [Desulfovibrio sp. TomC]